METHNTFIVNLFYKKKKRYLWEKTCIFKKKLPMPPKSTYDSALITIQVYEKVKIDKITKDSGLHLKQYMYFPA